MHVFLSPHYDDAVYSCGGTIYQLAQRGEDVLIVTVMGGEAPTPLPDTPLVRDLHRRWAAGQHPINTRKREDGRAAALLGAQVHHWDTPDCVYRTAADNTPLYPDEDSLWHTIHPDDPAVTRLAGTAPPPHTVLYAPLGVGGHVDHLIVRDWALAQPGVTRFYAEFPYIEQAGAVQAALAQFPIETALQPVLLTAAAIAAKIEGVRAYQSQISTFWQDEATLTTRVRAALGQPPAENYYASPEKS